MGPTRKRDLTLGFLVATAVGYLVIHGWYRIFPPITLLSGVSLLVVAIAEAAWGTSIRTRIRDGAIGIGPGRLHPLAVARSVSVAKASAWLGALVFGWWVGVLAYLLPRRSELRVAGADTPGAVVAAVSALALVVAGLWLQNCCKSPDDPLDGNEPDS
jgi:hypothetical protein